MCIPRSRSLVYRSSGLSVICSFFSISSRSSVCMKAVVVSGQETWRSSHHLACSIVLRLPSCPRFCRVSCVSSVLFRGGRRGASLPCEPCRSFSQRFLFLSACVGGCSFLPSPVVTSACQEQTLPHSPRRSFPSQRANTISFGRNPNQPAPPRRTCPYKRPIETELAGSPRAQITQLAPLRVSSVSRTPVHEEVPCSTRSRGTKSFEQSWDFRVSIKRQRPPMFALEESSSAPLL